MTDTARLQIKATTSGITTATTQLDKLEKQGTKTEKATNKLGKAIGGLALGAAALTALAAAGSKLVSVTREFESFRASLETSTGSAERAAEAFEAIQDFASNTPYSLAQATEGFTKLVNLGLTPSERAMESYGNTASAMGKDLMQMVEAVADAATGEFERLKEFGIKAKNQGDTIAFTFRGMTKEVANNAAEIEEYLTQIGENEFAGQMEKQMATLNGAISNFGDEFNKVFDNINQMGAGDIMKDSVMVGVDALQELNSALASGQLEGYIDAISIKFSGLGDDMSLTLGYITSLWSTIPGEWGGYATAAVDWIVDAFVNLPENLRAVVGLMTVELASLVDYGTEYASAFVQAFLNELYNLVDKVSLVGSSIRKALNPFEDYDGNVSADMKALEDQYTAAANNIWETTRKNVEITSAARRASVDSILDEHQTAITAYDEQLSKSGELREAYEKEKEARALATEGVDRLAQFKVKPEGGGQVSSAMDETSAKEYEKLVESLRSQEEAIQESYERRVQLIENNTEEESQKRIELLDKVREMRDTELVEAEERRLGEIERIRESLLTEEEALLESYENRKAIILESTELTEKERLELMERLSKQHNASLLAMEKDRNTVFLQGGEQLFGSLADMSRTFAGEQSGIYKAMFAASKAFAMAESIVKIQQGIASAAATPFPANLAAIGSVIAATSSIISTISSTQYSGAYDQGGYIPAGKVGLVGEIGPELVSGPANVTGREDTLKQMSGGGGLTLIINNNVSVAEGSAGAEGESTEDRLEATMNEISQKTQSDILTSIRENGLWAQVVGA